VQAAIDQSVESVAMPPAPEAPSTPASSPQLELGIDEAESPGRARKEASG
jgi:hypothetical protein